MLASACPCKNDFLCTLMLFWKNMYIFVANLLKCNFCNHFHVHPLTVSVRDFSCAVSGLVKSLLVLLPLNRYMQQKTFGNQGTPPGICHIGSSIFSFNIFRDLQLESLILVLHIPSAADTGCCALEIGKCQPQYRNEQLKLIQQLLI